VEGASAADGARRRAERGGAGADTVNDDELDRLSTHELHDRAVRRAERHVDVRFFWSLLELIPAAAASHGDTQEADLDIRSSMGLIKDALHSGDGELGEALRPVFIDYLRRHPDA
jgi:hypothetical protein